VLLYLIKLFNIAESYGSTTSYLYVSTINKKYLRVILTTSFNFLNYPSV
jgi:hypothetical protein